ncbi:hypothetical protein C8Q75DRAFT_804149 [Abortiporus biennis]|nr:hypothetical protein C8Q75DRAFT_804149 [Abortiporus biennis]
MFNIFKSRPSTSSKRSSVISTSTGGSHPARFSVSSDTSSSSYFVQLPNQIATNPRRFSSFSQSTENQVAEMLDDDNMSWGKPPKKSKSRRH